MLRKSFDSLACKMTVHHVTCRYLNLVNSYPQYFYRQKWQQPGIAALAGYVWIIMLESQPDSPEHWKQVSAATKHSGKNPTSQY